MSKSSRKNRSGTPAARSSKSVGALRAERAVGSVTKPFVEWCEQTTGMSAAQALDVLGPVTALAVKYFDLIPAAEVTGFEVEPFDEAMARLFENLAAKTEDEAKFLWDSIHLYIDFLRETGTWTGTAEDSELVHDMFHVGPSQIGTPQIAVPDLTLQQVWESLAGTVLAQRMETMLRWVGTGRDVTSTGVLRLKDIAGAGAAIGLRVTGVRDDALNDFTLTPVKKMRDVHQLMDFWQALKDSELIKVGSTRAWLTPEAKEFLDDGDLPADRFWTLNNFTSHFIDLAVNSAEEVWDPWTLQIAAIETAVLAAACTDSPPETATIHSTVEQLLGSSEVESVIGTLLARLNYLAELGIITVDTHVQVVPAFVGFVTEAVAEAFPGDDEDDTFNDLTDGLLGVPEIAANGTAAATTVKAVARKGRTKNPKAPIYQLKVSIQHISPPLWRRLLVRSDASLGDVHLIIQNSFEWEDYHLHAFQVGGRGGAVYGPPDPNEYGDPSLPEDAYALSEVLPAEGDFMVYTYDFGDDWDHLITVEKVLPADPTALSARCTAGRGRGPAEDSGGPWGWTNVLAAVNDPKHGEHKEYRRWLGLSRGEKFDPQAFDLARINKDLVRLF